MDRLQSIEWLETRGWDLLHVVQGLKTWKQRAEQIILLPSLGCCPSIYAGIHLTCAFLFVSMPV